MKKCVLLIGNGFDLALGYKTSYVYFANTGVTSPSVELGGSTEFMPFKELSTNDKYSKSLHNHFAKFWNDSTPKNTEEYYQILWIDVEGELLSFAESKRGEMVDEANIAEDYNNYLELTRRLGLFIKRIVRERKNKPDDNLLKLLNTIKSCEYEKFAYTFNYTNLASELEQFCRFSESELPIIHYMHGSIATKDIIIGINEDKTINPAYRFMFKSFHIKPHNLSKDLIEADEIISYGLSWGKIDRAYFQSFFDFVVKSPFTEEKRHFTIFTKGDDSAQNIQSSLFDMNFSINTLKEHLDFNIINVDNIKQANSYDAEAFNALLQRLSHKIKMHE